MQEVKNLAQEVRVKVLENRDEEAEGGGGSGAAGGPAGAGNEGSTGVRDESGDTAGASGSTQE
jgi:hypothetical protein